MMMTLLPVFLACLVTSGLIVGLLPWAKQRGWVDSPQGIKQHTGAIPWIGGWVFWIVFFVLNTALGWYSPVHGLWLLGGWLFLFLGTWDDLHFVSAYYRLAMQCVLAGVLYLHLPLLVWPLPLLGSQEVYIRLVESLFFLLAAGTVINGMNMLDGQDGLLGGVTLTQLFWFVLLFTQSDAVSLAQSVLLLMAALAGFLVHNISCWGRQAARVFMGNSGSYALGWTVLCLGAYWITLGQDAIWRSSLAVLWILYLPTLDCLVSVVRRAASSAPLFSGDRGHVHHLLQRMGVSTGLSTSLLCLFSFVAGGVGYWFVCAQYSLYLFFLIYFIAFFVLGGLMWWLDRTLI